MRRRLTRSAASSWKVSAGAVAIVSCGLCYRSSSLRGKERVRVSLYILTLSGVRALNYHLGRA